MTLATLMYEILLTRIFSVTMWYHFAFLAISVAMFGMTVGAIVVYLLPGYFRQESAKAHMALSALCLAVSMVLSFLTHLCVPFLVEKSLTSLYSLVLTCTVIAIPFVFSGICVSIALTKFPAQVSKLYAADLCGAALGCILLLWTLSVTDGPTSVVIVGLIAALGALYFALESGRPRLVRATVLAAVMLLGFAGLNMYFVNRQFPLLRLVWVKDQREGRPLYEKWNSFSRIIVDGDPNEPRPPFGWGLSPACPPDTRARELVMLIDASAATVLTHFAGDTAEVGYLKYDVTNLVHYLRPNSKMLVVGTGGGRDVLSALTFGQRSVTGVEINENILGAVTRKYGDFTGHLDRYPQVTLVNDEARSYVARSKERYDIIQVSLIDSWAATTAGAFVLTENSLYTVEAWKIFLEHLSPSGVLTFSRWYFRGVPGEVYRLTSLASAALLKFGVDHPRDHIIVVKRMQADSRGGTSPDGVGTMLVSREPFTEADIRTIERVARAMRFEMVLSPRFALDRTFETLAAGRDLDRFMASLPLNMKAPTDDSPFFFHMLRLKDTFRAGLMNQGRVNFNVRAVAVLGVLMVIVAALTILCILMPLYLTTGRSVPTGAFPLFLFFAAIGLGFMLVEISQMQRLTIFLGHPVYGLSVVLFALLLSSGVGSYLTRGIDQIALARRGALSLVPLLLGLVVFGVVTPRAIQAFQSSGTPLRILVACAILAPLGLFMGMAFPLGMKAASVHSADLTPWLWGINGATSVCASVLAVVVALNSGISTAFWTGFSCYAIAAASFAWASRGVAAAR